ncbi:MAG: hypothetical protein KTR31_30845 [Myxococcales bacterium]|nr:hypothetical protein [Myxococcales bacterium]
MVASLLLAASTLFSGCTKPPVYQAISGVIVHHQTASGTTKNELTGDQLEKAVGCLYSTTEIPEEQSKEELLQAIILLQVKDRLGDRMFELYTTHNFKGNKGKYYKNECIYSIIRS